MSIRLPSALVASAALALLAFQSPAHAVGADPTVDFGSLKAEFAAEDAGASYGDKRRRFRASQQPRKRGFRAAPRSRTNFSSTRRRK